MHVIAPEKTQNRILKHNDTSGVLVINNIISNQFFSNNFKYKNFGMSYILNSSQKSPSHSLIIFKCILVKKWKTIVCVLV